MNDSLAGITPLLLKPSDITKDTRFELRMKGFDPLPVLPSAGPGNPAFTLAVRSGLQGPPGDGAPMFLPSPSWNARKVGIFVSGGVSIWAG